MSPEERFAAFVRERHGFEPERLVARPELDGGGFVGLVAVAPPPDLNVRGLVSGDEVLTWAVPGAFEAWLAAVDFAHAEGADPVRFGQVHQALSEPAPPAAHAEAVIPLLYEAQVDSAPVAELAEPVSTPRLMEDGAGRSVELWVQGEPGSRFEHWTFRVADDNTIEVDRRPARER